MMAKNVGALASLNAQYNDSENESDAELDTNDATCDTNQNETNNTGSGFVDNGLIDCQLGSTSNSPNNILASIESLAHTSDDYIK